MKKNLIQGAKTITLGTIAAMAVTVSSCNDDISLNDASAEAVNMSIDAFGCGYRLLSVTSSTIGDERIPVNSKDIQLVNSNSLFSYRIIEDCGQYYIVPAMSCKSGNIENDVLTLKKKDGSAEKDILITYTPETEKNVTRAASADNGIDAAVVGAMTKGFIPGKIAPDAQANTCLFYAQSIYDVDACAERDFKSHLLTLNKSTHGDYFYDKSTDHNEIAKSNAKSAGFNLAVPVSAANVSIGLETSTSTSSKTVREVETAMYGYKCRRASASMDIDFLSKYFNANKNKDDKMADYINETVDAIVAKGVETDRAQVERDVRMALGLQAIMDNTAIDVLNNNGKNSAYNNYDNNKDDDMRALISKYGMYIGTGCQVGGIVQTTLEKESSSSEMSMEEAVKLTVEAVDQKKVTETQTDTGEKKDGDKKREIKGVIEKIPTTASSKVTFSNKTEYSEIQSALKIKFHTLSWGGNLVNDIERWDLGDNCDNLAVISFAAQAKDDDFAPSAASLSDNRNFIPLWKLCIDPDRREALRKLIEPDGQNKIGYFDYKEKAKKTLLIADMKLKIYDNMDQVKPFFAYDSRPDGKKMHLYIPMRCNENYIDAVNGTVLDLAKWQNLSASSNFASNITKHMVALVAYEYVFDEDSLKDYTGIVGVDFGGKSSGSKVRSGDETFFMTTGSKYIDRTGDHFLLVQYAQKSTSFKDRFKGVGLFYTNNGMNGDDHKGKVFASSLGTDWSSNDGNTKKDFENFWGGDFVNKNIGNAYPFYQSEIFVYSSIPFIGDSYKVNPSKQIYPCGTTKTVTRDVEAEIANIVSSVK